jgi:hypothetical protein
MWMGYADSARSMNGFRGLAQVTGGTIPAQLWHNFMAAALGSEPQWAGSFPGVSWLAGIPLTPPAAGSVLYPEGLGTTTTSSTTTTSVPGSTTTVAGKTKPTGKGSTATTQPGRSGPTTTTPVPTTRPTATTPPTTTGRTLP